MQGPPGKSRSDKNGANTAKVHQTDARHSSEPTPITADGLLYSYCTVWKVSDTAANSQSDVTGGSTESHHHSPPHAAASCGCPG